MVTQTLSSTFLLNSYSVFLIFCLLFFFLTVPGYSKEVNGVIHGNVTWDGYIHVVGDVKVAKDGFLTIEPGTVIEFAANQNIEPLQDWDHEHSWIIVNGGIDARGTKNEWITITSDEKNPGDWACIYFNSLQRDSIFQFCDIEYGTDLINTTALEASDNRIQMYNNIIHHGADSSTGILVGQAGKQDIQYNTIYKCRNGIDVYVNSMPEKLTIKNNIITHNWKDGIANEGGNSITTSYNNVWNNDIYNYDEDDTIYHSNDINVDPMYVDLSNNDVQLQSESPCLNASADEGEIGAYGSVDYAYNVDKPSDDGSSGGGGGGCVMNPNSNFNYTWLLLLAIPVFILIRRKCS